MKLKPWIAALALAAAAATPAMAMDLGVLDDQPDVVTRTFTSPGLTFADDYIFDLVLDSDVSGSATNLKLSLNGIQFLDIANFSLSLYDSSNTFLGAASLVDGSYQLNDVFLTAGNDYYFRVAGTVTGWAGGSYSFSAVAQPIPEPETYALMLAGLGALGYMSRRRRQG